MVSWWSHLDGSSTASSVRDCDCDCLRLGCRRAASIHQRAEGAVLGDLFAYGGGAVNEGADEQGWSGGGSVKVRWYGAGGS